MARLAPARPVRKEHETAAELYYRLRQGTGTLWTECEALRAGCTGLANLVHPDYRASTFRPVCWSCAAALREEHAADGNPGLFR